MMIDRLNENSIRLSFSKIAALTTIIAVNPCYAQITTYSGPYMPLDIPHSRPQSSETDMTCDLGSSQTTMQSCLKLVEAAKRSIANLERNRGHIDPTIYRFRLRRWQNIIVNASRTMTSIEGRGDEQNRNGNIQHDSYIISPHGFHSLPVPDTISNNWAGYELESYCIDRPRGCCGFQAATSMQGTFVVPHPQHQINSMGVDVCAANPNITQFYSMWIGIGGDKINPFTQEKEDLVQTGIEMSFQCATTGDQAFFYPFYVDVTSPVNLGQTIPMFSGVSVSYGDTLTFTLNITNCNYDPRTGNPGSGNATFSIAKNGNTPIKSPTISVPNCPTATVEAITEREQSSTNIWYPVVSPVSPTGYPFTGVGFAVYVGGVKNIYGLGTPPITDRNCNGGSGHDCTMSIVRSTDSNACDELIGVSGAAQNNPSALYFWNSVLQQNCGP